MYTHFYKPSEAIASHMSDLRVVWLAPGNGTLDDDANQSAKRGYQSSKEHKYEHIEQIG